MIRPLLFILLFCFTFSTPSQAFDASEVREIRIEAAVSPGFQALPNWRSDFEKRLVYASRIFENEFKIKFKLIRYVKWSPFDEKGDMVALLDQLRGEAPLTDVDMVIGLTHYQNLPNTPEAKDLHTIGQARPFSGHLIIRYPANKLFRVQEDTVLAHEIGHAFGAIHTDDRNSIMSPVVERQIPTRFDPVNRQIISKTRALNFQKGPDSLPPQVLQILLQSYLKMAGRNGSSDFYYSLGLFYLQLGQPNDAIKSWKMAVSLEPNNSELRFNLGALYYKNGDFDRAIPELSRAVSGTRSPITKPIQVYALTMLGQAYFEQENMFAAFNAWTRAIAMKPRDIDLQTNLAMVKMKQGQLSEAINTFHMVLAENPKHLKALRALGSALSQDGKPQEALEYLELALAQLNSQPRSQAQINSLSVLYGEIGAIYLKMDRQKEAFEHFQAACDLTPNVDCHKQLGKAMFNEKQWDAAIREFANVIQTEKKDPDIYGMLGTALAQKGDLNNAINVFEEGLKYATAPKMQALLHRNIGNLYLSINRYAEAQPEFQMAISKDWQDVDSHFGLAVSQLGKEETISAVNTLRDILRIDPNNKKAKDMLLRIQDSLNSQQPNA